MSNSSFSLRSMVKNEVRAALGVPNARNARNTRATRGAAPKEPKQFVPLAVEDCLDRLVKARALPLPKGAKFVAHFTPVGEASPSGKVVSHNRITISAAVGGKEIEVIGKSYRAGGETSRCWYGQGVALSEGQTKTVLDLLKQVEGDNADVLLAEAKPQAKASRQSARTAVPAAASTEGENARIVALEKRVDSIDDGLKTIMKMLGELKGSLKA